MKEKTYLPITFTRNWDFVNYNGKNVLVNISYHLLFFFIWKFSKLRAKDNIL